MSAIKGQFGYLYASIWQYWGEYEWEQPLQDMMMDYSIHKVSFLKFIAANSFWKF